MAIKKSELYSSLWQACNDLRGGMDASQYKDYILVFLFIKYVSDKYAGTDVGDIEIPEGASFTDMVKFKGNPEVGDLINKKIIDPLATASNLNRAELPDFNDSTKLGDGQEKVERLTNLIAIFENPALDFSSNKADGDDILGDAYEYLMRHFATESGKSKGQFYTPAEVSRIMARLIGIDQAATTESTTVYDPTCGSGSLLLRIASAANTNVSLYGQEKDSSTSGLARMNMILHNNSTAEIVQGNTLATPKFVTADGQLQTFDYVVANPPFSDKKWTTGVNVDADPFGRFDVFGMPPHKQGDYAYLLHIIRSMKPTAKAACILPHGVLFRGNAEATIRTELLRHGYIKAVIGLPANLFFGTGIPACIIVLDKENAQARKGVVMIDASKGFIKDGPKNRLRERDLHKIVDTYVKQDFSNPRYARLVGLDEIARNGFNLNIPRYIDSSEPEDLQDIEAHLEGGVPVADIDQLAAYWTVYPTLKAALFQPLRDGYMALTVPATKRTEVGVIPEDWEISSVGAEFYMQLGKMLDENKNSGQLKLLLGNRSVQWGVIDTVNLGFVRLTRSELSRYRLVKGDILVCEGGEVGRAAIWKDEISECYFQKALHRLRSKRGYNRDLFINILHWKSTKGDLQNFVTQTSIAHLPKEKFELVPIQRPSMIEQTAIATALSNVDALITELQTLIAKKQAIKTATMQQLLTGRTRLPQFALRDDGTPKGYKASELGQIPEDWKRVMLGEVARINMGQSPSSSNYNNKGQGLPLIQGNADISNRKTIIRNYTSQITKRANKGDLILSVRAPVGEVAIAVFDCCIGRGVCALSSKNNYLYQWLIKFESEWGQFSKGSTFDSINSDELKTIMLAIPPSDKEQTALANILSDMDSDISNLQERLSKAQQIKQGMMQQLLTGKIRLITPAYQEQVSHAH